MEVWVVVWVVVVRSALVVETKVVAMAVMEEVVAVARSALYKSSRWTHGTSRGNRRSHLPVFRSTGARDHCNSAVGRTIASGKGTTNPTWSS